MFEKFEERKIIEAIKEAERQTSGEIRVHIASEKAMGDVEERALKTFDKLEMEKTQDRNGVLFYIDYQNHQFAIFGDEGIHKAVGQQFWEDTEKLMEGCFKRGDLVQGLVAGITLAGEKLKTHFPYQSNDTNELPDEISYS